MFRNLLFLILLSISQLTLAFSYTMEIPEQEIQKKVSAMMPVEKQKLFATIKVSDARVRLIKESDEIGVGANLEVSAPGGIKSTGQVKLKGSINYDASKGAFYLDNPVIENIAIDQLPEQFHPQVKQLTQVAIGNALARYPVYQFKDSDIKHKAAKAVLKSVAVKKDKLLVTLGAF